MKEWIKNAFIKRSSQWSTVIVFETSDMFRISEFLEFAVNSAYPLVLKFDVWNGLQKLFKDGNKIGYEPYNTDKSAGLLQNSVEEISELKLAERALLSDMTLLVIEIYEKDKILKEVLRSWAQNDGIYKNESSIVVFTNDVLGNLGMNTVRYFIYERIPLSTEEEREHLIKSTVENIDETEVKNLVEITKGFDLKQLHSTLMESMLKDGKISLNRIYSIKSEIIRNSGILDITFPKYGFEQIGGYELLKELIKNEVIKILKNPQKALKYGIAPPRGLLLFGPPGVGKTVFALSLAKELAIPFIRLKTELVLSKWYGESEKNISNAFSLIEEMAPCVVFIDEIDRFRKRGVYGEHEVTRRVNNLLLEWLGDENRRSIIVGSTNMPWDLDTSLLRAGRLDYVLPLWYPDLNARVEIIHVHTQIKRKIPISFNPEKLAIRTNLWSGAEIERLILRAAREALILEENSTVSWAKFEELLDKVHIDIDERVNSIKNYMQVIEKFTTEYDFLNTIKKKLEKMF